MENMKISLYLNILPTERHLRFYYFGSTAIPLKSRKKRIRKILSLYFLVTLNSQRFPLYLYLINTTFFWLNSDNMDFLVIIDQ